MFWEVLDVRIRIVVVDLGAGEFKRFLCKLKGGKSVEQVEEDKDKDTPEQYTKSLKKLFDDLQEVIDNLGRCLARGTARRTANSALLQRLADSRAVTWAQRLRTIGACGQPAVRCSARAGEVSVLIMIATHCIHCGGRWCT